MLIIICMDSCSLSRLIRVFCFSLLLLLPQRVDRDEKEHILAISGASLSHASVADIYALVACHRR